MSNHNVIIIGITGVGKSTIGKLLAQRLKRTFIDLDKEIEKRCGVDIQTIFAIEGESGFRKRETSELSFVVNNQDDYVLSIGGGCVVSEENRKIINNSKNFVLQLYANVDALTKRLSKSAVKRPLFNNTDIATKLQELYNSRKKFYDMITDLTLDTSDMLPKQVIKELLLEKNCNYSAVTTRICK